jgi:hypothetical protein
MTKIRHLLGNRDLMGKGKGLTRSIDIDGQLCRAWCGVEWRGGWAGSERTEQGYMIQTMESSSSSNGHLLKLERYRED